MRGTHRRSLMAAAIALGLACSFAANADSPRDFSGRISAVSASSLVVDNRSGDELRFVPADKVVVSGRKQSWSALAKGDDVSVSWKIGDSPRKAYRVVVLPSRGD